MGKTPYKWIIFLAIFIGFTACGIKGPPRPPNDESSQQMLSKANPTDGVTQKT
jgi:predicted small lipoprotein YifL